MPQFVDSTGKGYWGKSATEEGHKQLARPENIVWDQVSTAPERAKEDAAEEKSESKPVRKVGRRRS